MQHEPPPVFAVTSVLGSAAELRVRFSHPIEFEGHNFTAGWRVWNRLYTRTPSQPTPGIIDGDTWIVTPTGDTGNPGPSIITGGGAARMKSALTGEILAFAGTSVPYPLPVKPQLAAALWTPGVSLALRWDRQMQRTATPLDECNWNDGTNQVAPNGDDASITTVTTLAADSPTVLGPPIGGVHTLRIDPGWILDANTFEENELIADFPLTIV